MNAVGIAFRICKDDGWEEQRQHEEHAEDRDEREDRDEPRRALLTLELAAVFDEVSFGHFHFLGHRGLDVGDDAREVAALGVAADDDPPAEVLALHLVGAGVAAGEGCDVRDLVEVDVVAIVGQFEMEVAEVGDIGAVRFVEADHEIEAPLSLDDLRHCHALEGGLDEVGDIGPA